MSEDIEDGDKNDTYYCTWRRTTDGGYVGWELRKRKLRAEAESPDELCKALGDVIGEYYCDFEAALVFDPPLESSNANANLFTDNLVTVGWNGGFWFERSADTAFERGRCKSCGNGLGARSPGPLVVSGIWSNADGAQSTGSNDSSMRDMPGSLTIISAKFLSALTKAERAAFEARPVTWVNRRRTEYFEMVPKKFLARVAVRNLDAVGWRCDKCKCRSFAHPDLGWAVDVVSREDLKKIRTKFFFVGTPLDYELCMPHARWRALREQTQARGIVFERLAVVDARNCVRRPRLPTLEERLSENT